MRFLLFNAVVGLALVYLFNGGEMPTGGFRESVAAVQDKAQDLAEKARRQLVVADAPKPKAQPKPEPKAEPKGYAKDVIPAPAPKKPRPVKRKRSATPPPPPPPAPGAKMASEDAQPLVEPLPLPEAKTVASRPVHSIDESKAVASPVERRRDAVLADGPVNEAATASRRPVALKEGTHLMSAAERRRQLDSLAEEMEMLYLEKIGG